MTGRHRYWHRAWTLDAAATAARHESGLTVRFEAEKATSVQADPPRVGGRCWTPDGRVYRVVFSGTEADLQAWMQEQARRGLRDQASLQARLARLMREAGELWVYHLTRSEGRATAPLTP